MKIYLDYAATTPVREEVVKAMAPFWQQKFGNASSLHSWGQEARAVIEKARSQTAEILNCHSSEIIFTGTTTVSDNLAILGTAKGLKRLKLDAGNEKSSKGGLHVKPQASRPKHFITSAVEHHSVLDVFKHLESKEGFDLTILPVDKYGMVDPDDVKEALRPETILVSIMYANNEVGTIEPVGEIGKFLKKINVSRIASHVSPIYFHTDAATAAEYLTLNIKELGVDLLTLGAHKFGGPKGAGLLYVRQGTPIEPLTFGGHHERTLWPGTEAVPLIVGATKALELSSEFRVQSSKKVIKLRDKLIKGILEKIPETILTGHPAKRLPDIASFCFKGAEGEAILLALNQKGIAASSGSACTSGGLKPSHVLLAMGIPAEIAHGSIRFSLGRETTEKEIDYVLEVLPEIIERLRAMAPKLE